MSDDIQIYRTLTDVIKGQMEIIKLQTAEISRLTQLITGVEETASSNPGPETVMQPIKGQASWNEIRQTLEKRSSKTREYWEDQAAKSAKELSSEHEYDEKHGSTDGSFQQETKEGQTEG